LAGAKPLQAFLSFLCKFSKRSLMVEIQALGQEVRKMCFDGDGHGQVIGTGVGEPYFGGGKLSLN